MKKAWLTAILSVVAFAATSQDTVFTLDDELLRSAEQWAKENLDDDALRVLQEVDREKVRKLLEDLQKEFHGNYVLELADLKETAKTVMPLLEAYEETLPFALWLKPRLDYLEVADQFRLTIPAPKVPPGELPVPRPNPTPEKEREVWIKKLSQQPWPENSKPYVSQLKPIFAAQKIPEELVWLAEVESGFDPRARSPKGAAGLFQLMPATAKQYGLRTWPLDQRLKSEPSGRVAAEHLSRLHRHYKDWRLAVAAYNAGEGTVDDLLKRRKARSFEDIATRLPAETQMYVPKVEATILRREGVKFSDLEHRF